MQTPPQLDPIRFEVVRNALVEATQEMASSYGVAVDSETWAVDPGETSGLRSAASRACQSRR